MPSLSTITSWIAEAIKSPLMAPLIALFSALMGAYLSYAWTLKRDRLMRIEQTKREAYFGLLEVIQELRLHMRARESHGRVGQELWNQRASREDELKKARDSGDAMKAEDAAAVLERMRKSLSDDLEAHRQTDKAYKAARSRMEYLGARIEIDGVDKVLAPLKELIAQSEADDLKYAGARQGFVDAVKEDLSFYKKLD